MAPSQNPADQFAPNEADEPEEQMDEDGTQEDDEQEEERGGQVDQLSADSDKDSDDSFVVYMPSNVSIQEDRQRELLDLDEEIERRKAEEEMDRRDQAAGNVDDDQVGCLSEAEPNFSF